MSQQISWYRTVDFHPDTAFTAECQRNVAGCRVLNDTLQGARRTADADAQVPIARPDKWMAGLLMANGVLMFAAR